MSAFGPGALFSAGDAHYAQGDCETCGTAIEMNATLHVRRDDPLVATGAATATRTATKAAA